MAAFLALFLWNAPFVAVAASSASSLPPSLGVTQMLTAASLVTLFGGLIMSSIGLSKLSRDTLVACVRSTVQLFLLGSLVLQNLLVTKKPAIVCAWIVGVGLVAAHEAFSRVEYKYEKLRWHITVSVLTSGLGVLGISLVGRVFGDIHPWYQPRTLIPVAGMLFGNTLSAVSLAAATLTREVAQSQNQLELRLARGASSREAILPLIQTSLTSALTPAVNALAVAGVVHVPGMMTGQILAGQSPHQAALYQLMILFLITATACSTVQLLTVFITRELMNMKEHRLLTSGLVVGKEEVMLRFSRGWWRSPKESQSSHTSTVSVEKPRKVSAKEISLISKQSGEKSVSPTLKVDGIVVKRANVILSFNLSPDQRTGITGKSGIGKTQVLRTLAGLEHCDEGIELNGVSVKEITWPAWRRQVVWVSQDRPALDGTPRNFYDEICSYHSQKSGRHRPEDIAAGWGIPKSLFDQSWASLSGGEAQRVSLAIALSLDPAVLLLDEAISNLDEETQKAVEKTLASCGIPIVIVTHSRDQLNRFCTHHIDLNAEQQSS